MPRARTLLPAACLVLLAACDRAEPPTAVALAVPHGVVSRASAIDPGTRILFSRNVAGQVGNFEIYSMNPDGTDTLRLTDNDQSDRYPALSPDGSKILFTHYEADGEGVQMEIYVMNADGSNPTNLTNDAGNDSRAAWSPDGSRIAFTSDRAGDYEIYVMNADGSNVVPLTDNAVSDAAPAWSPDGSRIAFASTRDGGDQEICVMKADGTEQVNLTSNTGWDFDPAWTPDGRIGFTSDRADGRNHVFVMDADGTNPQQITSGTSWDDEPAWSPDGTQIAVTRSEDIWVMGADGSNPVNRTATAPGLTSGTPNWGVPLLSPPPSADLEVVGNVGSGSGKTLVYTFAVQNAGPDAAGDVGLTAQLPSNARFVSVLTTQGSCTGPGVGSSGTIDCALGTVAAGGKVTTQITLKPIPARAKPSVAATVTSTTDDPNPANNALMLTAP